MEFTGYQDKNGHDIHELDRVVFEDRIYEVCWNNFLQGWVIDAQWGQKPLEDIAQEVEIEESGELK